MEKILDEQYTNKEINLSNYQFRGKLSGRNWKRDQALNRIDITRKIILVMSLLVFYPVVMSYLALDQLNVALLIERIIYSLILLACGLLFYKFRLAAMIVALLPMSLILATYLLFMSFIPIRTVAFIIAIIILILVGIYFHFQEKSLKKELISEIRKGNPEVVPL